MKNFFLLIVAVLLIQKTSAQCGTTVTQTNVTCNGTCDGNIAFASFGGTSPWTLTVDGVPYLVVADTNVAGNCPGTHHWVLTDAIASCVDSGDVIITEPTPLSFTINPPTNVSCNGGSDGSATTNVSGGTPPYNYVWSPTGGTNATATGLIAGNYNCTVTDANGCTATSNITIAEPTALVANINPPTNVSCNGGSDGSACVVAGGGTGAYTYVWMPTGYNTVCANNIMAGNYTVVVTDANGCTATSNTTISESTAISLSIGTTTDVTCNGGNNGSVAGNASGGISPYTFAIDGGAWQPGSTFNNLPAGNHTIAVMDANGCIASQNFSINEPPPLSIAISPNITICPGSNTQITASGGISYQWSPAAGLDNPNIANPVAAPLSSTIYTVTVTDLNGCTGTASVIVSLDGVTINIGSIPPSCGQCDAYATPIVTGGGAPYTYHWNPLGQTTLNINSLCPGMYTLFVTDAFGCAFSDSVSLSDQCDSVWPGDANLDGVADNNDVLALGISFGSTGATRPGATNMWTGQTCLNWNNELISGTNYKHSDCDGNGIVNADDTLAVSLNYGLTHLRPNPPLHNASIPDLYLEVLVDTTGPNQLLFVKMHLGTSGAPVPAVYGLAFTLTFDQTLIDTTTASFDYSTSALGTIGSDLLSFQHSFYSGGAIDVAITRTNQTDVLNVDSVIGIFEVVITDNVSAVDQLRFDIANVTAMTHTQSSFSLNAIGDSVTLDPAFVGIPVVNPGTLITVYPSPVKDQLKINSLIEVERAEMINELGETIIAQPVHQKNFSCDMSGIKNGMYFLQLTTSQGPVRKKVCVMK